MPPDIPPGKINVTDPDSRTLKTAGGYLQGYNAQAVVTEDQGSSPRRSRSLAGLRASRTDDGSRPRELAGAGVEERRRGAR